jgi:hypothetical protein
VIVMPLLRGSGDLSLILLIERIEGVVELRDANAACWKKPSCFFFFHPYVTLFLFLERVAGLMVATPCWVLRYAVSDVRSLDRTRIGGLRPQSGMASTIESGDTEAWRKASLWFRLSDVEAKSDLGQMRAGSRK